MHKNKRLLTNSESARKSQRCWSRDVNGMSKEIVYELNNCLNSLQKESIATSAKA